MSGVYVRTYVNIAKILYHVIYNLIGFSCIAKRDNIPYDYPNPAIQSQQKWILLCFVLELWRVGVSWVAFLVSWIKLAALE